MTLYTDKIDSIRKIARCLCDSYYNEELSELTLLNVKELIESLEGFDQDELELTEETLSEVLETWYEMQEEELDLDLD